MVSAIGGSGLVQTVPARVETRKAQETAATSTVVDAGTAAVPSAQALATARVGGQLDAQFDAGRVQRAQEEAVAVDGGDGETDTGAAAADTDGTAEAGAGGTAAPAAGGARMGAGAAGGSDSAASDYIAEADTNNDRKLSEEERAAYMKKQAREVAGNAAAQQSREQEVRQAYGPQETSESRLDISA
ncbi:MULTISPECIES: hypothetical protein [unclassified Massilia]|uniref:hypothetical protein n=1 Tax=unclassified Massilia TaxID=2609279 RepID=UPI00178207C6|nr:MULTISPECIES: hypothetical protein [unclassified Massilia]MBD8529907.1 hypothetical protein [Massilia sp. CFBP 13647]MBD8672081.1 hypothetical protein [Massilia sp. CFBP 13721]